MPSNGDLPMLFARHRPTGEIRHVDEVERGLACDCECLACGQDLISRQGDKNAHSFAHRTDACAWAVESVIVALLERAIAQKGTVALPPLGYHDANSGTDVQLSPARTMRVSSAIQTRDSGRGAPDLLVTVSGGGRESTFAIVASLSHAVSEDQAERLMRVCSGIVLVDLRTDLRERRKELERHYDRDRLAMSYQDPEFIARIASDLGNPLKTWLRNWKAEDEERRSAELRARRLELRAKRAAEACSRSEESPNDGPASGRPMARHDATHHLETDHRAGFPPSLQTGGGDKYSRDYDVAEWERQAVPEGALPAHVHLVRRGGFEALLDTRAGRRKVTMLVEMETYPVRDLAEHADELAYGADDFSVVIDARCAVREGWLRVRETAEAATSLELTGCLMREMHRKSLRDVQDLQTRCARVSFVLGEMPLGLVRIVDYWEGTIALSRMSEGGRQ